MLLIRDDQVEALAEASQRRFERRAVAHLKKVLPIRCEQLGSTEVLASVRKAARKAAGYGLTDERQVFTYLNLMYVLGPSFDEERPWARELLEDARLDPGARLELLLGRARKATATKEGGP